MTKWIALGAVVALVLLFIFLPGLAWTLVGLLLLILAVVLFVPIGADVSYVGGAFALSARVDGFAIQLLPKKPADPNKPPKEEKPKKEKKPKESEEKEKEAAPKRKLNFSKEEILELIKKALKALGKFGKLTVRKFMLHYTAAGDDPYNTAMTYNYVNAALSVLAPICARTFRVTGDVDVWTKVDFTTDKMRLDTELSMTIRLWQVVRVAAVLAVGALGVLIRNKQRLRKEAREAGNNGDGAQIEEEQTAIEPEKTNAEEAEERNDLHATQSDRRTNAEHDGECEEHSQG